MSAFVYILKCADDSLYTGWTNDPEARLKQHNSGAGAKYTRGRRPVEMVFCRECADKSAALKAELAIKSLSRAQKQKLIAAPDLFVDMTEG